MVGDGDTHVYERSGGIDDDKWSELNWIWTERPIVLSDQTSSLKRQHKYKRAFGIKCFSDERITN